MKTQSAKIAGPKNLFKFYSESEIRTKIFPKLPNPFGLFTRHEVLREKSNPGKIS